MVGRIAAAWGGCGWAGGGCPQLGSAAAGAVEEQALCKLSVLLLAGESAGYPPQKWTLEPARCVSSNFGLKLGYFNSYNVPCACTYSQG